MNVIKKNRIKKVVFITPSFPHQNGKGYEKVLFYRIKYLKQFAEVSVLISPRMLSSVSHKRNFEEDGINYVVFPPSVIDLLFAGIKIASGKSIINSLYFNRRMLSQLKSLQENEETLLFYCTSRIAHSLNKMSSVVVVDFIDSMHLNFKRRSIAENLNIFKKFWNYEAERARMHDNEVARYSRISFCVSSIDSEIIESSNVFTIPLGVDVREDRARSEKENAIVFSGNLNYHPNVLAIKWFLENCWNLILAEVPTALFNIVGRGASVNTIKYLAGFKNVNLVGAVDDMYDELENNCISVAPMVSGSGMQNKILEAMAVGLPVLTTNIGLGDIAARNNEEILIADEISNFVAACLRLLNDSNARLGLGERGRDFVQKHHSWASVNERLKSSFSQANIELSPNGKN